MSIDSRGLYDLACRVLYIKLSRIPADGGVGGTSQLYEECLTLAAVQLESLDSFHGRDGIGGLSRADHGVFGIVAEVGGGVDALRGNVHFIIKLRGDRRTASVHGGEGGDFGFHARFIRIGIENELRILNFVFRHIHGVRVHTGGGSVACEHLFEGMLKPKRYGRVLVCRRLLYIAVGGIVGHILRAGCQSAYDKCAEHNKRRSCRKHRSQCLFHKVFSSK